MDVAARAGAENPALSAAAMKTTDPAMVTIAGRTAIIREPCAPAIMAGTRKRKADHIRSASAADADIAVSPVARSLAATMAAADTPAIRS